ncbi:hypothetical protein [Chroococcidiopsis sp. CCMEE 29]|uniref:hypothetical protein n=1 Tax=Chroococcidiopsis sp. CCMEE 29 TaxID=155894 RepID=UPI0020214EFD|nr:hypothetical protein [Chroococcidiopsis sp. CCMEE 29]
MTKSLTIHHEITVSDEEWLGPFITFNQWLPNEELEALIRERDNYIARLWIGRDCVASLEELEDNYISRWVNIRVRKVYVEVVVCNISEELAKFIYDERESSRGIHHGMGPDNGDYEKLSNQYHDIGLKVLEFALTLYNRFIAFARNHKHQFWLSERLFDENLLHFSNVAFRAKVRSEDYEWVEWCPPATDLITIYSSGEETSISKDDWHKLQEFVSGNSRPKLVLELLANAQLLIQENRRRSAIIEAVSALEIAVSEFAKSPKIDSFFTQELLSRIETNNLKSQIDHLGFSGTVKYLLPILFPKEVLPTETIKNCQQAIERRNNVVHYGQRDISPAEICPLVASVRSACEILTKYTKAE